jgi:hypothetical protein
LTIRETAVQALLNKLTGLGVFTNIGRRNTSPETIASPGNPALLLLTHHENYVRAEYAQPPKRTLTVLACVYIDTGTDENAVPDTVLNTLQDAIDGALVADDRSTGRCTLGGAVFSAHIKGEVIRAPGDKTGKGLAVIPIDLILP